jgi:hypothetical protein
MCSARFNRTCSTTLSGATWFTGIGGIRKARAANPGRGKGKRGGFRYLCLNVPAQAHIHLLYLLGKDEQEDLDAAERVKLRHWAEQIRNQP